LNNLSYSKVHGYRTSVDINELVPRVCCFTRQLSLVALQDTQVQVNAQYDRYASNNMM